MHPIINPVPMTVTCALMITAVLLERVPIKIKQEEPHAQAMGMYVLATSAQAERVYIRMLLRELHVLLTLTHALHKLATMEFVQLHRGIIHVDLVMMAILVQLTTVMVSLEHVYVEPVPPLYALPPISVRLRHVMVPEDAP